MKNTFLLLIACLFLFASCTDSIIEIDEENFRGNSSKIVGCHDAQNWSEKDLKEAIIGKWKYEIGWCGWTGLITPDFDKKTLKFENDGTVIIKTDKEERTKTWEVKGSGLVVGLTTYYVCGDKITTYGSPQDGCDLIYSK